MLNLKHAYFLEYELMEAGFCLEILGLALLRGRGPFSSYATFLKWSKTSNSIPFSLKRFFVVRAVPFSTLTAISES